jgi:hypothetical protein
MHRTRRRGTGSARRAAPRVPRAWPAELLPLAPGGPLPGAPVPAASPGQSALSFDAATGTYQFNWKTEEGWRGTCREFALAFTDGTRQETHTARLDFR